MSRMKPTVLYASRSGNTKKIAEEIAQELNCKAIDVTEKGVADSADIDDSDLILIGTGIRYGHANEALLVYLKAVDFKAPKIFALFVTWGGAGKTSKDAMAQVKSALVLKGRVLDDCFLCFGGWNFLRRGHPNQADGKAAREWAKKTLNTALNG